MTLYNDTTVNGSAVGLNYGLNPDGSPIRNAPDDMYGSVPQYGGYYGGANVISGQYSGLAAAARQRGAVQENTAQTMQDRGYGTDALALQANAAGGGAPSAANMQMAQGSGQALDAQLTAANSARPGGNMALAQAGAMQGGQSMQAANVNQAAMGRAQEMAAARAGYANQAGALQNIDQKGAAQQASLQAAQNALNDQTALGYEGLANSAQLGQLNADQNTFTGENSTYQQSQDLTHDNQNKATSAMLGAGMGLAGAFSKM
jgi:hypothetical protein